MAPRWTYIDPAIAFNPMLSFQVVIMALLGGAGALLGPLLGVIPLVLLFEVLSANFPNYFSILLGLVFIVIVYALPNGVVGLIQTASVARERANGLRHDRHADLEVACGCARRSAASSRSTASASTSHAARSSG